MASLLVREGSVVEMVYSVEQGDRHVYCSSPRCIESLLRRGFRLSDTAQLQPLVRELSEAPGATTHDPSDHLN